MWALVSVVRWHGTALLTVAAHADSGLSAPAVICQTERMQGSEFLELGERGKRWRKWERKGCMKKDRVKTGSHTNARIYHIHTQTHTHTEPGTPRWVSDTDAARLIRVHTPSHTCSLALDEKPDSCDAAVTFYLAVVPVFVEEGLSWTFSVLNPCLQFETAK